MIPPSPSEGKRFLALEEIKSIFQVLESESEIGCN